jgi:hypothetical protein
MKMEGLEDPDGDPEDIVWDMDESSSDISDQEEQIEHWRGPVWQQEQNTQVREANEQVEQEEFYRRARHIQSGQEEEEDIDDISSRLWIQQEQQDQEQATQQYEFSEEEDADMFSVDPFQFPDDEEEGQSIEEEEEVKEDRDAEDAQLVDNRRSRRISSQPNPMPSHALSSLSTQSSSQPISTRDKGKEKVTETHPKKRRRTSSSATERSFTFNL